MANIIKIKRSVTTGNTPGLVDGEFAINQADMKFFTKNSAGVTKFIDFTSDVEKVASGAIANALNLKANLSGADFTGYVRVAPNSGSLAQGGFTGSQLEIQSDTNNGDAFIGFHRRSNYATRFGLTARGFEHGGFSEGQSYMFWTEKNFTPTNYLKVNGNRFLELGDDTTNAFIDFHTGGNVDFNARILAQATGTAVGDAQLYYSASFHIFNATLQAPLVTTPTGQGRVQLEAGGNDRTGYISFYDKPGARHGYIGFADANTINISAEIGRFNFIGADPTVNSNTIWHAGNFDKNNLVGQFTINAEYPAVYFKDIKPETVAGNKIAVLYFNNGNLNYANIGASGGEESKLLFNREGTAFFANRPLFGINTPWDSGNFDPNSKATLNSSVQFVDIRADRGNNTGVLSFGSDAQQKYIFFDGTKFVFNGADIYSSGGLLGDKLDRGTGGTVFGETTFQVQTHVVHQTSYGINEASGNQGVLEVRGTGATNSAAFMQFHRPSAYASYFGIDTDNQWKVGGWSAGAVAYRLAHEGNLDALNIQKTDGNGNISLGGPGRESGSIFFSSSNGSAKIRSFGNNLIFDTQTSAFESDVSIKNGGAIISAGGQVRIENVMDYVSGVGRIEIFRPAERHDIYADLFMHRNTTGIEGRGQGFGGVTNMIKMKNTVGPADLSNWNFLSEVQATGEGAGQHVAIYAIATRTANVATFGQCNEVKDRVYDPVVGMVNTEFGMTGNGPCGRAQRININLVYGAADIYSAGDHEITSAIDISAPFAQHNWFPGTANGTETSTQTGRAILLTGAKIKGNVLTAIDLSGMETGLNYKSQTPVGIRHPTGLVDTWDGGGYFGFGNNEMLISMPGTGKVAGAAMPSGYVIGIKVNVAGYGTVIIPCLSA